MSLAIEINGLPYTNFTSASVAASITAVARGFSFVSTADANSDFPVKIGDRVKITADGTQIIDGFIELLEVSYNDLSHEIRVGGRSYMADFVDSSVPTQFEFDGTGLQAIAENLLSAIGVSATVINEAGSIRDFADDKTAAEVGQNALEFLENYSRKRQVLLSSKGGAELLLARAGTTYAPTSLKNVKGAADNNILDATLSLDYSKRFYQYLVKSQLNPSIPDFLRTPEELANQEGYAYDSNMRRSRKLELNAEESSDSFGAADRAKWERNMRIGGGFKYSAKVVGNSIAGALWLPNTLVRVKDDFCQVDAELLIKTVNYDFDLTGGSTTTLTIIKPEALTLEAEQSQREANRKKTAEVFTI